MRAVRAILSQLKEEYLLPFIVRLSIRHVHGSKYIPYTRDELIVLCLVRDGERYIKSFIEHYFALGVKHIVFLDNGSTDATVTIAQRYSHITILSSRRPYRLYETCMKRYLVRRFSTGRWSLFADIDELFDYPFSNILSLNALVAYLNAHAYTACVAQMLDMFSEDLLGSREGKDKDAIKDTYVFYDTSNIQVSEYMYGHPSNKEIKFHHGGIRKTLFDTNNGLTKTPLIFLSNEIVPFFMWHHVKNARIADFSCVLLHYPFTDNIRDKVREAVETNRYRSSAGHEYVKYWERLKNTHSLPKPETACRFSDVNQLVQSGFLVVSEAYQQWVGRHASGTSGNTEYESARN